jgi:hypothetical protein
MTTALPACLLLLALGFKAQAHGNLFGEVAKTNVALVLPAPSAWPAQDTTKATAKRLSMEAQLTVAIVRPQGAIGLVEEITAVAPDRPESTPSAEGTDFNPETANLPADLAVTLRRPAAPMGRRTYRTRLVRTGRWASKPEAVEILTCTYAGPLVLAQLPATATTPSQLLAGPGYDTTTPLRPLSLTQEAVLRLCGDRAPQVRAYAMLYNLHFEQADEVARLFDYYNRIAVVASK